MVKKLHVDLAARNVALIEHRTAFSAAHPPLPSGWCRALESFGVDVSKSQIKCEEHLKKVMEDD